MRKLVVASVLAFSGAASAAGMSTQVLDCAYAYRQFGRDTGAYVSSNWDYSLTSLRDFDFRAYLMTAAHLNTGRTVGLVTDNGFYKIEYTEQDQKDAVAIRRDHVSLKISGAHKDPIYAGIMDVWAFRFNRRAMDYGFGSSIYWGTVPGVNFPERKAVEMSQEEVENLLKNFAVTMRKDLDSTERNLNYKLNEMTKRKEAIDKGIPEYQRSVSALTREKMNLESTLPAKKAEIERFSAKWHAQTDEDLREALGVKIGQLEEEDSKVRSRIYDINRELGYANENLQRLAESRVQNDAELRVESAVNKPFVEAFKKMVETHCAAIPGIK